MQILANHLDHYAQAHGSYPPALIPYLSKEFESSTSNFDPFCEPPGKEFYRYYSDGKGWILAGAGPDRKYDLEPKEAYEAAQNGHLEKVLELTYDPTNGTASRGDVCLFRAAKASRIQ